MSIKTFFYIFFLLCSNGITQGQKIPKKSTFLSSFIYLSETNDNNVSINAEGKQTHISSYITYNRFAATNTLIRFGLMHDYEAYKSEFIGVSNYNSKSNTYGLNFGVEKFRFITKGFYHSYAFSLMYTYGTFKSIRNQTVGEIIINSSIDNKYHASLEPLNLNYFISPKLFIKIKLVDFHWSSYSIISNSTQAPYNNKLNLNGFGISQFNYLDVFRIFYKIN
jgi:hypothetical protein